jgi:AbrB family looped-hinge helix DNA binding protein
MEVTIDRAGRLVIPKRLRDEVGLRPGRVDLVVDGAAIRIEPIATSGLEQVGRRQRIPAAGEPIDDDDVRSLRHADQR